MSVNFKINDIPVSAEIGEMVSEVAKRYGIEIPTLCHDPKVKSYGACGMCVIEQKMNGVLGGKLLRSCSTEVNARTEGAEYYTHTARTIQARKIALELLMSDHAGDCKAPCTQECPAETDCQAYVGLIANGMDDEAIRIVMDKIPLPASLGRVCPHPCEKKCRRGKLDKPVSIMNLKRYVADKNLANAGKASDIIKPERSTGKKVAVIGGGPAGLTVASKLALKGHDVTIYEQMPELGGMLRYGIPEYRLPKAVLASEIELLGRMGIKFKTGVKIGNDISFDEIKASADATVIAIGAWTSSKMRIPGEDLEGVLGGIDFLREVNMGKRPNIGTRVAISGGGNTAMDACRTAIRLGAKEVYTLYRRTRAEMPAEDIEIQEAEEEGVVFKYLSAPVEVIGEGGKVKAVRVQKMMLGEPDASGRRSPVPIEGDVEDIPVDTIIMAIGQGVNPKGFDEAGLELSKKNTFVTNEVTFETNIPGVFACGDNTNKGPGIAVAAIGEAQKAAVAIDAYLMAGNTDAVKNAPKPFYSKRKLTDERVKEIYAERLSDGTNTVRIQPAEKCAEARRDNFDEYVKSYTKEEAQKEAERCLECGCMDYYECKLIKYANQYDIHPDRIEGYRHDRNIKLEGEYFVRDVDKCILCGLCARTCEEITGKTILGLVGRGFNTIIEPEMGLPLSETQCLSCGLCVSVCPTGALTEKTALAKRVPLREEEKTITCHMCQAGCTAKVLYHGSKVTRVVPMPGKADVLCSLGRFDQPKYLSTQDQMVKADAALEGISGKIAVLVGASCGNAQIDKVIAWAKKNNAEFVASTVVGAKIEDAKLASVKYAAVHNGKAKESDTFYKGFNQEGLKKAGIAQISDCQKKALASGEIAGVFVFGESLSGLEISSKTTKVLLYTEV